MRTLKKTLCLVLALVMVLGLCAFNVSAAEFTDTAAIKYKEAVGVMQAAKVLAGFEDGSFRPDGTLTRAQAAKMIACMMGFGDLKGTSSFTDCKGHWADSYIAFCAKENIVAGYGDGTFGPEDTLTGSQWAKMVICAIGYNAAAEGISGADWEIAVAKKVKSLNLAANIEGFDGTKKISREQACELGFQGMKADMVKYTPGITVNGVEIPGTTATISPATNLLKGLGITAVATPEADKFGRPASAAWENAKHEVVYTASAAAIATVDGATLTSDFISKAAYLKNVSALTVYTNGVKEENVASANFGTKLNKAGAQVEFYGAKNSDGEMIANTAVVTEYKFYTITAINAKNGNITLADGAASPKTINAPAAGEKASADYTALKDFAVKDALAVCLKSGAAAGTEIMDVVKAGTVEGKVTAAKIVSDEAVDVTMNGTKYVVADTYAGTALALKSEGTLYLSPYGKVIGFAGKQGESTDVYAFVVDAYAVAEGTAYGTAVKYYVQAVDMNGQEISYAVTKATHDGISSIKNKLMKVTAVTTGENAGTYTFDNAVTPSTAEIKATDKRIGTTYFTSDVIFVYVSGSKDALKITVKSGVQAVAASTTGLSPASINKYYVAKPVAPGSSNYTTSVVFIAAAYETPVVTTSNVAFVKEAAASSVSALCTDKDGKEVTGWAKTVYIDGEKTEIYVADKAKLDDGFYTVSKNGDLTVLGTTGIADAKNLVATAKVTNVFGSMLSYKVDSADEVPDVTIASDVVLVNLVANDDATLAELKGYTVSLVLSADAKTITTIYVTAAPVTP